VAQSFHETPSHSEDKGGGAMSTVTYVAAIIVMGLVAIVLVRGLLNMMKGDNPNLSNRLMQLRVLLQAVAVILIMLTLWLTGGGRPA
jgi:hypothetical protein